MKAVIFGASGQDGRLLTSLLDAKSIDVVAVGREQGSALGEVADFDFVEALLRSQRPDFVFHLAANSSAGHHALFDNHLAISTGTLNILESARTHCPTARIFLSGSALQFQNLGAPINETTPFEAGSPYAIARIQSTYAGRYYRSAFGMSVYTGFLFHHDSPLRPERHVSQKVVRAVQRIAAGSDETLTLGDISVEKEFNYAGDVVEAIWRLVNQDEVFEAVIGCGQAHSIRQWVEYCFSRIGKDWTDHVEAQAPSPTPPERTVSDPSEIFRLGWRPKVSFEQLADMMLAADDLRL